MLHLSDDPHGLEKIGLGGKLNVPFVGLTLAGGYIFDLSNRTGRPGIMLRTGGTF